MLPNLPTAKCWLLLAVIAGTAAALRCKCTQNSNRTPCEDGVCDVETGKGSCLTLDHPNSGRHYACSRVTLPDGQCQKKVAKSGPTVLVCSCTAADFCNYQLWPDNIRTSSLNDFEPDDAPDSASSSLFFSTFTVFLLPIAVINGF